MCSATWILPLRTSQETILQFHCPLALALLGLELATQLEIYIAVLSVSSILGY